MGRDKVNLDIFWLRDESLEDSANLPEPDVLAREIMEDLAAALEQFEGIVEELEQEEDEDRAFQRWGKVRKPVRVLDFDGLYDKLTLVY